MPRTLFSCPCKHQDTVQRVNHTCGRTVRATFLNAQPCAFTPRHAPRGTPDAVRRVAQLITCKAETSAGRADTNSRVAIPQSKEQCISEACEAIAVNLQAESKKGKPVKGFKAGTRRLAVEIPVADESPASVVSLAEGMLKGLPQQMARSTLVFGSIEAALLASTSLQNQVVALEDAPDEPLTGPLLVISPSAEQMGELSALLAKWRGKEVVLVNAGWTTESAPSSHAALARSFEVVYCFQPIAIQAFVLTTQGAILRRATRAQPLTPPWQILKKGWGDNWKRIGQMARRPGSQDLELAFVNASASESPITAGLKAVRQLVPGKRD